MDPVKLFFAPMMWFLGVKWDHKNQWWVQYDRHGNGEVIPEALLYVTMIMYLLLWVIGLIMLLVWLFSGTAEAGDLYRFGEPRNGQKSYSDGTVVPSRTQTIERHDEFGQWEVVGYVDIHLHKVQRDEGDVEDVSVGVTSRINPKTKQTFRNERPVEIPGEHAE